MSGDRTVLITGFEAFGDDTTNPTARLVDELDGTLLLGRRVVGLELPVSAERVPGLLAAAVDAHEPELVLSLGLANGRSMMAVERVAVNVLDFPMPDNDGAQPIDEPVVAGAPCAYFATVPLKSTVLAWRGLGLPGYVSNSAGTYLCNATLFLALHLGSTRGFRAGLLHVPYLPEQVAELSSPGRTGGALLHLPAGGLPSMAYETMIAAVRAAVEVALTTGADAHLAGGAAS